VRAVLDTQVEPLAWKTRKRKLGGLGRLDKQDGRSRYLMTVEQIDAAKLDERYRSFYTDYLEYEVVMVKVAQPTIVRKLWNWFPSH